MKKKLLIITSIWTPYSHARFTAIAENSNIDLIVFFQNPGSKHRKWKVAEENGPYKSKFLRNIGIPISSNTAFTFNFNYDVYKNMQKCKPDLILTDGWDSFATLAALIYARLYGKEIVLICESTIHEDSLIRKISIPYVRFILRFFNGFISTGTASEEYLRFLGVGKRVERFYNTVDVDFFSQHGRLGLSEKQHVRERIGIGHDSKVIMFSGRLVAIKCVHLLIKAFLMVKKEFPKTTLLVAGYGPEEQKLKKMAGVNSGINFLGHQGIDKIPKLYGISDILVLPSISETWGAVVNEAMACGCAIIVSDKCGCAKDLIQENGVIVKGGSLDSLIKALRELLSSEERLNQMKSKSLKVIQRFRLENLVKEVSFFQT